MVLSQKKIRVALVGLNAPYAGMPTGTNWTARAHLPYLLTSSKYELVALQNSSAERAAKSIKEHGLDPEKVKAYGTPEEVAADRNVDLVVSSIRVDRHGGSIIPSIKAGKDVFVEWPLEANYTLAKELADLVKLHKVRSVVGLQGRFGLVVQKAKSLIQSGEIGKVESSTLVSKNYSGPTIGKHIDYFTDRKTGGNPFVIGFGHSMEFIQELLGEVKSYHSLLVNQYPEVDVVDPSTKEVIEKGRKNDVPNQIVFDAIMSSGAILTYKLHNSATISPGAKPKLDKYGTPAIDWRIFGSKAELRITGYETLFLNVGADDIKLEICRADDGELVELDVGVDEFENLPRPARNIARVYEKFAEGVDEKGEKKEWYPDFEYALKTHKLIDEMYKANGF